MVTCFNNVNEFQVGRLIEQRYLKEALAVEGRWVVDGQVAVAELIVVQQKVAVLVSLGSFMAAHCFTYKKKNGMKKKIQTFLLVLLTRRLCYRETWSHRPQFSHFKWVDISMKPDSLLFLMLNLNTLATSKNS